MEDKKQGSVSQRGRRKMMEGKVVSNKMDKTVVVLVERLQLHPLYGRVVKVSRKLLAHDEKNECHVGDLIRVMETRPFSRKKRWRVVEIQEKAQ
jgi:small subunit ribosomal protein S17